MRNSTTHYIDTRDVVKHLVRTYAKGRTLDVGGGSSKYRQYIEPAVSEYLVSDLYTKPGVDFVEDARKLTHADESYDTVVSFQVLEHIDDTAAVVREMHRVLKAGGCAIVTAPFIGAQHGHPSDYHRFTEEGMRWYFEERGFEVVESGTQGSTLSVCAELLRLSVFHGNKGRSRPVAYFWNKLFRALKALDRKGYLQNSTLYTNVYLVAKKRREVHS